MATLWCVWWFDGDVVVLKAGWLFVLQELTTSQLSYVLYFASRLQSLN